MKDRHQPRRKWARRLIRTFILGMIVMVGSQANSVAARQVGTDADDFVAELLSRMTVEEKVGEMTQLTLQSVSSREGAVGVPHELDLEKLEEALVQYNVGSLLNVFNVANTLEHWREILDAVQRVAERKRLAIPVLYGVDAVHGHNYLVEGTLFPQSLAMAATWNPDLVRQAAEITAAEVRATGVPWNFAPVLDLGRQPLWSRFFETYGEDVHLATVLGDAAIAGMQGDDISLPTRVAACAKHFVGYSFPLSGEDRTPAWIPERFLREYYLPTFQSAVDNGVKSVMINSGEINGVAVHASREILVDLLRDELGFEGVAVSDWEDIIKLHTIHRVAASQKEAVAIAVNAGVDMSMVPYDYSFYNYLVELVGEGTVPMSRIDEAVTRILKLKFELGLFENALPDPGAVTEVGLPEHRAVSLEAARESITLLKNKDAVLPLDRNASIVVVGAGADSRVAMHGSWSYVWQGTEEALYPRVADSAVEAIQNRGTDVTFVAGATFDSTGDIDAAVAAARQADVAIVVLAEKPSVEKPGDIEDLMMPASQLELASAILATGTPVILVLMENRPRIVRTIEPDAAAVLMAYQAGPFAGQAIAEILFGEVNPSGRLPFTYPRYSNSLTTYDHKNSERSDKNFGMDAFNPQWPFGHGMSYTTFTYSDLVISGSALGSSDTLRVQATITNTGERAGAEVARVFVRDLYASIAPPVERLRAFRKVELAPGETIRVEFDIPVADLAFVGLENTFVVEPGDFEVRVGGLSAAFVVTD